MKYNDFGRSNNAAQIQLKPGKAGTPQRFCILKLKLMQTKYPNPIPTIVTKLHFIINIKFY
jgi:hypothetical protein